MHRLYCSLTESLKASEEAIEVSLTGAPENLNNYAISLQRRFLRTGQRQDLNDAVAALDLAVKTAKESDPDRLLYFNSLGNALRSRFERVGDTSDLDRAIQTIRDGIRLLESRKFRNDVGSMLFNSLGNALRKAFDRTHQEEYLDEAIVSFDYAISILPSSSIYKPDHLNSLTSALRLRAEVMENENDLIRAISASEEALKVIPEDHPNYSETCNFLANGLRLQYDQTKSIDVLNLAIQKYREAIRHTEPDYVGRATHLSNLGLALERRNDSNEAFKAYHEAAKLMSAPPTIRILAAVRAARLVVDEPNAKASELYKLAVDLLPEASPMSLSMLDREVAVAGFSGLASEAAAVFLDQGMAPADVLSLLELGRGIIMGSILDIRSDLEIPSDLIETYNHIKSTLDPISLSQTGLERSETADPSTRHEAELRLSSLVNDIHSREGFENFRRPFNDKDFIQLAQHGPIVVINIDKRRCDALICTKQGVICRRLPEIHHEIVQNQVNDFRSAINQIQILSKEIDNGWSSFALLIEGNIDSEKMVKQRSYCEEKISNILKWLWDYVADPILSSFPSELSRIWWCPTGLMSFLPIHAAGDSKHSVIDRVISTYTSSVKALRYARKRPAPSHVDSVLIAVMPTTPRYEHLPLANDEAYGIKRILKRSKKSIRVVIESSITPQELSQKMPDKVIVHLICHALAETDASKSRLLLRDGNLAVAQISQMQLDKVALAYLSACSTANSSDSLLGDESLTLTSAFQVAGFPRVLGSLWNTVDHVSYSVAMQFYEELNNDTTKSANALHKAILQQRKLASSTPSLWAAFIYLGD